MNRFLLTWAVALVLPSLSSLLIPSAVAAEGRPRVVRLPQRAQQIDGFTCDVQLIDPEGFGYLPLRLEAQAAGGRFAADRTITARVVPVEGENLPHPQADYEVELTLRQGEASAIADYFLPKHFLGSSMKIMLVESGEPLAGYEFDVSPLSVSYQLVGQCRFALILADPQLSSGAAWERVPDMRSINSAAYPDVAFMKAGDPGRLDDGTALQHLVTNSPQCRQILYETEAHRQWLGYESVDVILVAYGVLERMRDSDPERFEAIRRWVICGGALWSYGTPDRESLAAMFDVTPTAGGDPRNQQEMQIAVASFDTARAVSAFDGSFRPLPGRLWSAEEMQFIGSELQAWWARAHGLSVNAPAHPAARIATANELAQRVFAQPLAAGRIIGITDADPFPGALQLWHVVRQLTGPSQVGSLRYGRPVVGGTSGYWEWVLENVARPPVYAFLGVMSGFVLLVGPVSYFLTRRRGRTYLMFLIAPVLATIATLLLFGYGVVADGLGTQVRIRQITWIDHGADGAEGSAARMTRATYFAGLRPAEGLKFPADAAVYPIIDEEEGFMGLQDPPPKLDRRITVDDQQQQFTGGFLPARRQRQFIATRPIDDAGGIAWSGAAGGAGAPPPMARNDFPFRVLQLIVRDADGAYHHASGGIPVGEEVTLQPLGNEGPILRDLYLAETLEPPLGYQPSYRNRPRYGPAWDILEGERQFLSQLANQVWARGAMDRGLLESRLRTMLLDDRAIPNGWFVGRAELTEDASAVDEAKPVESIHFIMGRLR